MMAIIRLIISGCRSVNNFLQKTMPAPTPLPTSLSTDEDTLLPPVDNIETILDEQAADDIRVIATCDPLSSPSPGCSSLSAGANMPYFGPTGRCKKPKVDETVEMFKETLSNLNESMAANVPAPSSSPSIDVNDSDVLIAKNVESCLKCLTNMALKLKYRKKFRALI